MEPEVYISYAIYWVALAILALYVSTPKGKRGNSDEE